MNKSYLVNPGSITGAFSFNESNITPSFSLINILDDFNAELFQYSLVTKNNKEDVKIEKITLEKLQNWINLYFYFLCMISNYQMYSK